MFVKLRVQCLGVSSENSKVSERKQTGREESESVPAIRLMVGTGLYPEPKML